MIHVRLTYMNYWLMKTEPSTYSWEDLLKDKKTYWDGVRNYQARNNMRAMKNGDLIFVYHSVKERRIVGIAKVIREAYPDHTAKEGDWSMVDIAPLSTVDSVITLSDVKQNNKLKDMVLVKNSRLSVQPVKKSEWNEILKMIDANA